MLPGRSTLLVQGPDAVRFVDNFTTAAVGRVAPAAGAEGFFTDARGHVLAVANILRTDDGLWIDAASGIAARLLEHLDHYRIRERVEFIDASADRVALLVIGPAAAGWLESRADGRVPRGTLDHATVVIGGVAATVVALDWFGPGGLLVQAQAGAAARLAAWLRTEGLPELTAADVEAGRIEAGSPEPADIDGRTLPQELGRDARAICLTKGCYLGQETVARLDALGHVNRRLVTLTTDRPPAIGAAVTAAGEAVGRVTSACTSRRSGLGLGLALVHVRGLGGTALEIDGRAARVSSPPTMDGAREEA